jgi:CHAT domain-containing protein
VSVSTANSPYLNGEAVNLLELRMAVAEGIDPMRLANELKAEINRQLHLDPMRALGLAELMGELADLTQSDHVRALGQLALADCHCHLGRYAQALAAFSLSAAMYTQLEDEVGWARTRIGAALAWRYTGATTDNLAEIDLARSILTRHQLWVRVASLEQHAGGLLRELGRADEATRCYERALEAARRLQPRDEPQEARITGNLALAHRRLGDYERAESLLASAQQVFEQHGHVVDLATAQQHTAQLLVDQGHYSRGLALATSTRRTFRDLGLTAQAAFVGQAAARCMLALNRFEDAAALATEVALEFELGGASVEIAATLLLRSVAVHRAGHPVEALGDLDRAEATFRDAGCLGWIAIVRSERAGILADAQEWAEAAIQAEAGAADLFGRGQIVSGAQAALVQASALRALGDPSRARALVDQVRSLLVGRGVPWLQYTASRLAGELACDDGRGSDAVLDFDAAIRALEQVQGRILTEARASFLQDKLAVYESAVDLCLDRSAIGQAFEYAERAKSRALVDALAGKLDIRIRPRTATEHQLNSEFIRLRRRHEQLSALATLPLVTGAKHGQAPSPIPSEELHACEQRMTALLSELQLANVADLERVSLLQGRVDTPQLDERTLLVEYFGLGDDLCVFFGRLPHLETRKLVGARRRVERLNAALQLSLQTTAAARDNPKWLAGLEATTRIVLGRLYTELIAPLATALEGIERLVVVPHGVLHRIPFAALHDGERYLVEHYEIVVGPSANALAFCRRPLETTSERAVVVANSDDGALPGALAEARHVAQLFDAECLLEADATQAGLRRLAGGARLIHLAAHGHARPDAPLFSYLRLADGHLTALDCFDLELDCGLVTLSACESGHAAIAPGDEPIGLPRALLYAGARSVVLTLWRVDDRSTAQLMDEFYTALHAGQGRAAALRSAQLAVLRSGRSHPFFWAPMVLAGDWGPLFESKVRERSEHGC